MAVILRDWAVCVGLHPDRGLLSGPLDAQDQCGDPTRVAVVCEHFLEAVNHALGTSFLSSDSRFTRYSCAAVLREYGHHPRATAGRHTSPSDACPKCGATLEWASLALRCPRGCGVFG